MPGFKNGIGYAFTEKINENSCCLYYHDVSILKVQGSSRDNPENYYWEETP